VTSRRGVRRAKSLSALIIVIDKRPDTRSIVACEGADIPIRHAAVPSPGLLILATTDVEK